MIASCLSDELREAQSTTSSLHHYDSAWSHGAGLMEESVVGCWHEHSAGAAKWINKAEVISDWLWLRGALA